MRWHSLDKVELAAQVEACLLVAQWQLELARDREAAVLVSKEMAKLVAQVQVPVQEQVPPVEAVEVQNQPPQ